MIFYIADPHLDHENVIRFDKRPFSSVEEMNETIIENWNKRVQNGDTVYILGDFIWGKEAHWPEFLERLNGHKILIRGNHDPKTFRLKEVRSHFDEITDYKEITDNGRWVIMCHYPIPFHRSAYLRNIYMLYGHVHNTREYVIMKRLRDEMRRTADERDGNNSGNWYNVGCMMPWMNYAPRTLDEIIAGDALNERIEADKNC